MTYATDLGYKVGDRFTFKEGYKDGHVDWLVSSNYLPDASCELSLVEDDGTTAPFFRSGSGCRFAANLDSITKVLPEDKVTTLAQHLVSKLFELGNEGDKLTNRISFMVGTYGVDDECSGGMNKVALEKFFERVIARYKENV